MGRHTVLDFLSSPHVCTLNLTTALDERVAARINIVEACQWARGSTNKRNAGWHRNKILPVQQQRILGSVKKKIATELSVSCWCHSSPKQVNQAVNQLRKDMRRDKISPKSKRSQLLPSVRQLLCGIMGIGSPS